MTYVEKREEGVRSKLRAPSGGLFAGLGAVVGFGALVGSSCCAVPLILAGLGASGAVFSGLEALVAIRPLLLGAAAVALVAGWTVFAQRRSLACRGDVACSPSAWSHRPLLLLSVGTAFLGLAVIWDAAIEPILFRLVR